MKRSTNARTAPAMAAVKIRDFPADGNINDLLDAQIGVIEKLKKKFEGMTDEVEDFGDAGEKSTNIFVKGFKRMGDGVKSFKSQFGKTMASVQQRVMQFNVASIADRVIHMRDGLLNSEILLHEVRDAQAALMKLIQLET